MVPQVAWLSPAAAAVYSPQQALPAQVIQDFLANPGALLKQYPSGGAQMISRVRDLAASDPSTLNPIVGLLATANANQSTAIGTGLGQVALMAVKTDQAYANQIQEAIASAIKGHDVGPVGGPGGVGSSQTKIGNAVKTIDQVEGVTDKGTATGLGWKRGLFERSGADRCFGKGRTSLCRPYQLKRWSGDDHPARQVRVRS